MPEPTGQELVERYKSVFFMPADADITEEMVLRHWELEKSLTQELLSSTPENRWETFERCYTQLYKELYWLNSLTGGGTEATDDEMFGDWAALVGDSPKRIYEVGSGQGRLITYLAAKGHDCTGTEITRERGQSLTSTHPNLKWGQTDGVHLGRFASPASFDVVITDQVVEHLHPDDLIIHMRGAHELLRPGGRYILSTPHRHYGPMDVSQVFGCDEPKGMHLREYDFRAISDVLRRAGFRRLKAPLRIPRKIRRKLGGRPDPVASGLYLSYLRMLEAMIGLSAKQSRRRKLARLGRVLLFDGVWLVAEK